MDIMNALPVGTVVKLKGIDSRVIIMGILQKILDEDDKETNYDYIAVPYPEGFLNAESTILFYQDDIETIFYLGFSDIERQNFISAAAREMAENK